MKWNFSRRKDLTDSRNLRKCVLKSILLNKIWNLQEEYAEISACIWPHSLTFFSITGYILGIRNHTKFIASLIQSQRHKKWKII